MLGRVLRDPCGVESPEREAAGLGLLPVETTFETSKATHQAQARVLDGPGWIAALAGQEVSGYEIHMGRTCGGRSWLEVVRGNAGSVFDGAASDDGRVWGCYLHGLFANEGLRRAWLASLAASRRVYPGGSDRGDEPRRSPLHETLDRLADAVETALDMRRLEAILRESDHDTHTR